MDLKQLEQHWLKLWTRIQAEGDSLVVFHKIIEGYSESHRKYHNLEHVNDCLLLLQEIKSQANDPDAVEFALWLHDIVYDPKSNNNEYESAQIANDILKHANLPYYFRQSVSLLILATKHIALQSDFDCQLIADIDLAGLGLPGIEFDRNTTKIREEYSMYTRDEFVAGRANFIETFLKRQTIYQTPYFIDKFEKQAKENLLVSLAWLQYYPFHP